MRKELQLYGSVQRYIAVETRFWQPVASEWLTRCGRSRTPPLWPPLRPLDLQRCCPRASPQAGPSMCALLRFQGGSRSPVGGWQSCLPAAARAIAMQRRASALPRRRRPRRRRAARCAASRWWTTGPGQASPVAARTPVSAGPQCSTATRLAATAAGTSSSASRTGLHRTESAARNALNASRDCGTLVLGRAAHAQTCCPARGGRRKTMPLASAWFMSGRRLVQRRHWRSYCAATCSVPRSPPASSARKASKTRLSRLPCRAPRGLPQPSTRF